MPVSRHHPRSIYLIPVAYPPLSSSAPSSSSSKGKRARGVLPSPLTSTLLRHARKLALDPAAHEDEAKEEELRRPAVLLPCKPMGEREAASAQGASDWNSLMLKARKERGAMFDAASQSDRSSFIAGGLTTIRSEQPKRSRSTCSRPTSTLRQAYPPPPLPRSRKSRRRARVAVAVVRRQEEGQRSRLRISSSSSSRYPAHGRFVPLVLILSRRGFG